MTNKYIDEDQVDERRQEILETFCKSDEEQEQMELDLSETQSEMVPALQEFQPMNEEAIPFANNDMRQRWGNGGDDGRLTTV